MTGYCPDVWMKYSLPTAFIDSYKLVTPWFAAVRFDCPMSMYIVILISCLGNQTEFSPLLMHDGALPEVLHCSTGVRDA